MKWLFIYLYDNIVHQPPFPWTGAFINILLLIPKCVPIDHCLVSRGSQLLGRVKQGRGWGWWIGHLQRVSESSSDACMLNLGRTISLFVLTPTTAHTTQTSLNTTLNCTTYLRQSIPKSKYRQDVCVVLCTPLKNMIWLFQSDGQWQWPWLASDENTCPGLATCCSTICKIQTLNGGSAQCLYVNTGWFLSLHWHPLKSMENRG